MFEIDMLFEKGRIEIRKDGEEIIESKFKNKESSSGSGFMVLEKEKYKVSKNERLLNALTDIIKNPYPSDPQSSGKNALEVQKIIEAIFKSSKQKEVFKKIGC